MTASELEKRLQEIAEENRRTDEHLAQVRKEAKARIERQLQRIADKKTIISFEEE